MDGNDEIIKLKSENKKLQKKMKEKEEEITSLMSYIQQLEKDKISLILNTSKEIDSLRHLISQNGQS